MNRRDFLKRATLAAGGGVMLSVPIAACSSSRSGGQSKTASDVTLTEWDGFAPPAEVKALTSIESGFAASGAGVTKVSRTFLPPSSGGTTKILSAAASHTLPDIYISDPGGGVYAADGLLLDLTSRVQQWGKFSGYSQGVQDYCSYQGKVYGLPFENNNLCMFYNADMLSSAGVSVPQTWAELTAAAKKLTSSSVYGFAVCGLNDGEAFFQYLPTLWQGGADLNSLTSPAAVSALTYWAGLVQHGYSSSDAVNWGMQDTIEQFISQKAAICYNGPWNLPTAASGAKFNWGVAPLPMGVTRATVLGGEICMITSESQHPDQAFEFLTYLNSPSRLDSLWRTMGAVPSQDQVSAESYWKSGKIATFVESMAFARPRNYGKNYPTISNYMEAMLQSVMLGKTSAEAASKTASAQIMPLLPT
jgi:multiple sugar transport system substrate-binding protein